MTTIDHAGLITGLVFCVAFLYSSVGLGGASSYLAVMSLFAVTPAVSSTTALTLNIFVATLAFVNYARHGYLKPHLVGPSLLGSIPAAFIGGMLRVDLLTYQLLLNTILLYAGLRLLFIPKIESQSIQNARPPAWMTMLAGAVIGLVSGIVGIGGGIFLSPLIVLAGWGTAKQAAAASAIFVVLNSVSGLAGRLLDGALDYGSFGWMLIPAGVVGGLMGSSLGVRFLSGKTVQRLLGIILLILVIRFATTLF